MPCVPILPCTYSIPRGEHALQASEPAARRPVYTLFFVCTDWCAHTRKPQLPDLRNRRTTACIEFQPHFQSQPTQDRTRANSNLLHNQKDPTGTFFDAFFRSSDKASSSRAPGAPAQRPIWSRAYRRDLRRHAAHASVLLPQNPWVNHHGRTSVYRCVGNNACIFFHRAHDPRTTPPQTSSASVAAERCSVAAPRKWFDASRTYTRLLMRVCAVPLFFSLVRAAKRKVTQIG